MKLALALVLLLGVTGNTRPTEADVNLTQYCEAEVGIETDSMAEYCETEECSAVLTQHEGPDPYWQLWINCEGEAPHYSQGSGYYQGCVCGTMGSCS